MYSFQEFGGPGAAQVGVQEELSEEERKKMVAEQKRRQFDEQKRRLAEFGAVGGRTMNADALIESIIGSKADKSVPGKKPEVSVVQVSKNISLLNAKTSHFLFLFFCDVCCLCTLI